MNDYIIRTNSLTKKYFVLDGANKGIQRFFKKRKKEIIALENLNLNVSTGEILGIIGANGAGKSTTIKLFTGILYPSFGNVSVFNLDPAKNRRTNSYKIGVMMGQRSQLWWDLPAVDSFKLYAKMYGVDSKDYNRRITFFNSVLQCEEFMYQPVRQLSLGQRMRCELIATFIHAPQLVFLDEPTIGIDIIAKEKIYKFIEEMNREYNTTFILTTHDLSDMEKVAEHILLIDKGKTIFDGSKEELLRYNRYDTVKFRFNVPPDKAEFKERYPQCQFEGDTQVSFVNNKEVVSITELISEILSKYNIDDINISKSDIETVVKNILNNENYI